MNGEMVQAITVALAVAKAGWNVAAMERCSAAGCPLGAGTCPGGPDRRKFGPGERCGRWRPWCRVSWWT